MMRPRNRAILFATVAAIVCACLKTGVAQTHETSEKPAWCRKLPHAQYAKLQRVAADDAWFEVYRVAPNVLAIYEPHQSEETIGYLIEGNARALVFDTGMGIGDLKALISRLCKLPIVVVNSHTHNDHAGNNWQFDTVYGMDTDFTRASARGSKADAQAEIAPGEICGALPAGFDRSTYATRPWKIAKRLHDGEHIDLGGRTLEVIATPGHTPDSISLFDRANGLLFTGDTFYPGTVWLYRPETNLADYGKSIARLAALKPQVKMVLGAHNVPVSAPSVLDDLVNAFAEVNSGRAQPKPAGTGKVIYTVGGISFLMRAPAITQ